MKYAPFICRVTGASHAKRGETLQTLWSGCGHIIRYHLTGGPAGTVIVKHVEYPRITASETLSDRRKRHSYEVEAEWYREWAGRCDDLCPVPRCYGVESLADEMIMVL